MLVDLLGSYAPGHVLSHEGLEYTFRRIDQATKAALTVAYFKRAREAVYAIKGEIEPAEYERQLSRVTDAYRRGEFSFPLGESYRWFLSEEGLPELVAHLTDCSPEQSETLCEERAAEVLHIVLCVVTESSPQLKKTLLAQQDSPAMQALASLLSTNGSPPPSATAPPGSRKPTSVPTGSPG